MLNPSGIRFGSAEIYNVIETQFAGEVVESLCVGQRRPQDLDESVFLFLLMKPGQKYTPDLVERIRVAISKALSRRHVPKYIFETPEIPVCIPYMLQKIAKLTNADNRQREKGRAASQADCVRETNQTIRNTGEPAESGVLLPVCRGGEAGHKSKAVIILG